MALVHMNIIKGTTRTVYNDSLMGSSKAMFIIMSLLVNIGAKFKAFFLFQIFLSLLHSFFRFVDFPIKSHFLRRRKIVKHY